LTTARHPDRRVPFFWTRENTRMTSTPDQQIENADDTAELLRIDMDMMAWLDEWPLDVLQIELGALLAILGQDPAP